MINTYGKFKSATTTTYLMVASDFCIVLYMLRSVFGHFSRCWNCRLLKLPTSFQETPGPMKYSALNLRRFISEALLYIMSLSTLHVSLHGSDKITSWPLQVEQNADIFDHLMSERLRSTKTICAPLALWATRLSCLYLLGVALTEKV